MVRDPLKKLAARRRGDVAMGFLSVCSANMWVVDAVLSRTASIADQPVLIEATANQVNADAGYSGMTPAEFVRRVNEKADALGIPRDRFLIGGDHIGTFPWRHLSAGAALEKGCKLVTACVRAGMVKLHLDAAAVCGGDPETVDGTLPVELAARRCACLASAAEAAFSERPKGPPPFYVIGTDVPLPGGAPGDRIDRHITSPDTLDATIRLTREQFAAKGIADAFERVIAVVVQPGMDYSNLSVVDYDSKRAALLVDRMRRHAGLVFEAHSTDYQPPACLGQLVEDGFVILKGGPAFTFAFREAVFGLAMIEAELIRAGESIAPSRLVEALDRTMREAPEHWRSYYTGDAAAQTFLRRFALTDRCRYYWSRPEISRALDRLLANLGRKPMPLPLLSQYFPGQLGAVRSREIDNTPQALIRHRIQEVIDVYFKACGPRYQQGESVGSWPPAQ